MDTRIVSVTAVTTTTATTDRASGCDVISGDPTNSHPIATTTTTTPAESDVDTITTICQHEICDRLPDEQGRLGA